MTYNVPADSDLVAEIKRLRGRVERLERAPQSGNTSMQQGTFSVVNPSTSETIFRIGALPNGDYGIELYRDDGTIALRVGRLLPANPDQVIRMYDKFGVSLGPE